MMPEITENESKCSEVHAVSIKMPEFMHTAAESWFLILESQFHLKHITVEETKFYHVISCLPPTLLSKLPKTLITNKIYEDLKKSVIEVHEETKPELFSKLIATTKMTGRPSVYLQELQSVASKCSAGDDLVRHQFVQASPSEWHAVLASQRNISITDLGKLADELHGMNLHRNQSVNRVQSSYSFPQHPRQNNYHQHSDNNDFGTIPFGVRPFRPDQRPKICKGHIYFAESARTCKPWCRWPNKQGCQIQPNSRHGSPSRNSFSSNSRNGSPAHNSNSRHSSPARNPFSSTSDLSGN